MGYKINPKRKFKVTAIDYEFKEITDGQEIERQKAIAKRLAEKEKIRQQQEMIAVINLEKFQKECNENPYYMLFDNHLWKAMDKAERMTGCRNCGARRNLTLDHIISRKNGGSDLVINQRTLCRSCNSSKGSKNGKVRTEKENIELLRQLDGLECWDCLQKKGYIQTDGITVFIVQADKEIAYSPQEFLNRLYFSGMRLYTDEEYKRIYGNKLKAGGSEATT